ncbi:MAG: hypothetical protein DRR19_00425 [Candidatus Parabeggiatoa sp. nov. 1]|nr:MAG: hypothetical protein DRR19_00425 [Gammaproteobacteria bacterium]
MMTKTVFIIGNKRSGSTQLVRLMNLHPNVFMSQESDIIWILYRFHHNLEIVPYQWDTPVGMNHTLKKYAQLLSRDKTPLENFVTIQTNLMKDGFQDIKPMHKENLLWIGDKKPFQQIDPEIVPFIKEHFPNSKFIHLIRHPFAAVKSSKVFKSGELWKGTSEKDILKLWTRHESRVQLEKDKNEVPMLDVRYEDIISQTRTSMARLFDFLELKYDKQILLEARKITRSTIRKHPRFNCPPETEAIMSQYGYKTKSFWLENPLYVNSFNGLKKLKRKITGIW